MQTVAAIIETLPGLDCGLCGCKNCEDFAAVLLKQPEEIKRCVHLGDKNEVRAQKSAGTQTCGTCDFKNISQGGSWLDSLGREFDFILDTFPNEPGPRETILPHNPLLTREMNIQKGEILIGRPLGMSCGCPITHCGIVTDVDPKTGVIVWCVTGPLGPRHGQHKDIGYYSAEAYEGLVKSANTELKIGMRYFFLPHRCMLQWRHSGLINFINKNKLGTSVRIEGLWIG